MLSYSEMLSLLPEIKTGILGKNLIKFMQINPTSYVFVFSNIQLLICVQKPFSCFHLTNKKHQIYPSVFADQVNKILRERACVEVFLLSEDRILTLRFEQFYFIAELMYHHPILAVTDSLFAIMLSNKPTSSHYKKPLVKPAIHHAPTFVTSKEIEERYQLLEKQALLASHHKKISNQLFKLEKQLQKYQKEYCQAKDWQVLQNETELLKSHLYQITPGMKSIQVMNWEDQSFIEIALDPSMSIQKQLQARFKEVRKRKKRLSLYPSFIEEIHQKVRILQKELSNPNVELSYQKPSLKKERNKACDFHTFIDKEYTILVGKNAKGNEKLTFTIAKGNDTWLHITPMAGSHVIIKAKQVNEVILQDAMQLALYFSQARKQNQAEVLITEVKYVSRTKTTGKVLVSKHRTKKVQLDLNRVKELLKKRF
ncbi:NFACT RNA binding domain-containing protein [Candidatus Rhabdochlamydia porcellionis]|jgi:predicted ribosome quality control (RQC) complex YloA/Tae2 family protein|uniref:Fibronectin-binding protein A N-terminus (FbpA) n=1 Tax=Candidatus Rhabdochlamydia porcellionis TaxID=225148 RepID=A0ABX8YY54_9BACT|nr:NFACT RNA binding domain-containing protein [Candidatus Rhabdochlamydia porcellionis]QZA58200.1 Fibronectin-binding protein A N-terminus (FbpA) [Candidatus Rhabdochlamydia porcellionis]